MGAGVLNNRPCLLHWACKHTPLLPSYSLPFPSPLISPTLSTLVSSSSGLRQLRSARRGADSRRRQHDRDSPAHALHLSEGPAVLRVDGVWLGLRTAATMTTPQPVHRSVLVKKAPSVILLQHENILGETARTVGAGGGGGGT